MWAADVSKKNVLYLTSYSSWVCRNAEVCLCLLISWVGWVQKGPKHADVIYGWSLVRAIDGIGANHLQE